METLSRKYIPAIRSFLVVVLFSVSLWLLYEKLEPYHIRDIVHSLWQIRWSQFFLALGITVLSYLVLTTSGILDLRSMERRVGYRKAFLSSFMAAALNNNIGSSSLLRVSFRSRLFSFLEFSKASFLQALISSVDWFLSGTALYLLLRTPSFLPYGIFLGIFFTAKLAGLLSQIPGGLGIFEAALLILLPAEFSSPSVFASLLIFRGIYYLLPLSVATALLAGEEILRRRKEVKEVSAFLGQWIPNLVPQFLTFNTFVAGAILLFSGALPLEHTRLAWLEDMIPLPVIEASHFLGSLTGMLLLLLARGLQKRLDGAYFLTSLLLGVGILSSLLKGFDYEDAILLSLMLAALLPSRRYFYRRASLTQESFTPAWTAAIMMVVLATLSIGLFSYKHVEYSADLWWRFALFENAPRFLRAAVTLIVFSLFFSIAILLRPARIKSIFPDPETLNQARVIVKGCKQVTANLALLGDKAFLFSPSKKSFIMYGVHGRSWVALGDPVGPEEEWGELVWEFRELCDRYGGWPVFSEVGKENLHYYLDLGLSLLKAGEEGRVSLRDFSLEGGDRRELRYFCRHAERENCTFQVIPQEEVPSFFPEFRKISEDWLARKNTKEKGFSLAFFKEDYLKGFPFAVVKKEGEIVAFADLWLGAEREEMSLDLMRYSDKAPKNVMDYLFIQSMLWGAEQGYQWFNLGMAPLAGLESRALAPLWTKIGALVFRFGEHFYNFQGVRLFKDKFNPVWAPKYLASPGGLALPRIFTDIAALNSGGFRGIFGK